MPKTVQIDLDVIAGKLTGLPITETQPPLYAGESIIHRFGDDALYLITDAGGGYTAIFYPGTDLEEILGSGHLSDFEEATRVLS